MIFEPATSQTWGEHFTLCYPAIRKLVNEPGAFGQTVYDLGSDNKRFSDLGNLSVLMTMFRMSSINYFKIISSPRLLHVQRSLDDGNV